MSRSPWNRLAIILGLLCWGALPLSGQSIPVVNPGFEADILSEGGLSTTISGWYTSPGGGDGVFNVTPSKYPDGAPEGENVAYVNLSGNRVWQVLTASLEANTCYWLQVEVGNRLDESFNGARVQLLAGGVLLAEDTSAAPGDGEFVTSTLTYVTGDSDPLLGQALEIQLLSGTGYQANFDDVRLYAFPLTLPRAVTILNPGFEADVLNDGSWSTVITDWDTSLGGGDGVLNPLASQYSSGVPEGDNVAYVNLTGNRVRQVLSEPLKAGTFYLLEVEVGDRLDESFAGYRIQLLAGGVLLAESSSPPPPNGGFVTSRVEYLASPMDPLAGQPLEIKLLSLGVQANFDDVRLTAIPMTIFLDGFESGNTSSWSAAIQ